MDHLHAPLSEDDLRAPDFPMRGEINEVRIADARKTAELDEPERPDDKDPDDDADWIIGDSFKPTPSRPLHSTRCVAINRGDGKRCRRWAVIGFTKCPVHSGYGRLANLKEYRERVLERARLDLLRTAPYAVETIAEMVQDPELNPAVRLKASLEVLDRVGIRGGSELQIDASIQDAGALTPAEEVKMRLDRLRTAAVSTAAELPAGESEIEDAELVEEDSSENLDGSFDTNEVKLEEAGDLDVAN